MKNWKKCCLIQSTSVFDAIKNLEETGLQIILVVNKKKEFIVTLTDGDIRAGILNGLDLKKSISNIVIKNPVIAKFNSTYEDALVSMDAHGINHIPIVKNKKILGIYFRNKNLIKEPMKNLILIMAGGRGKRLMPLTKYLPKPLLKYKNKTLIDLQLNKIINEGFKNVFLSLNYLKEKIINKIKKNKKYNLNIRYIIEKIPLGTAGCLHYLKKKTNDPIIIINCDIISGLKYAELLKFHKMKKSDLTVVIKEFRSQNPFGQIKFKKGKVTKIVEKPISLTYVNAGIYVVNPTVLNSVVKDKYLDMNGFVSKLMILKKKVVPYPIIDKWNDVSQYLKK
jgi:choline kinase